MSNTYEWEPVTSVDADPTEKTYTYSGGAVTVPARVLEAMNYPSRFLRYVNREHRVVRLVPDWANSEQGVKIGGNGRITVYPALTAMGIPFDGQVQIVEWDSSQVIYRFGENGNATNA